jgi:hypothetical protein
MHPTPITPWYRQFWPWFLIALPLASMVLSINMLRLALSSEDSLVKDDYYKQGKAINFSLEKVKKATALGLQTQLIVEPKAVQLSFTQGAPVSGAALALNFYHVTQKHKDQLLILTRDASGVYRAPLEQPLIGKWQVSLQPHDGQWKILQTIVLPQPRAIPFNP